MRPENQLIMAFGAFIRERTCKHREVPMPQPHATRRFLRVTAAAFLRLVAVAGPAPLAVLTALYIGRPSPWFLATGITLAVAILACDGWIIARHRWITGVLGLTTQIAFLFFLSGYAAAPLPAPPALAAPLPPASPPTGMAIYALPTGVNHRTSAFAVRGGSPWEKWDSVMNATLVRHPQGDVLIDTGLGKTIMAQMEQMPFLFRLQTDLEQLQTAADQLDAAGYNRQQLRYILLTHAHWDHVSGVPDFPGVPVLVTEAERRFIDEGGRVTVTARNIDRSLLTDYTFEGRPYLGFDRSHDLYGDGSLVIVPAPGHTPGSVVVFVTLPGGARYAFVGDLVWQLEGILEREERPWATSKTLGEDSAALRNAMLRMSAIASRYPQITIVPAHDARGYASIPEWSGADAPLAGTELVNSVAYSPDGTTIVVAYGSGNVGIWDARTRQSRQVVKADNKTVLCVAISPDGKTFATAGWDGKVKVWSTSSLERVDSPGGFDSYVSHVCYSLDGRFLAAGGSSNDDSVKVWRLGDPSSILWQLDGHSRSVQGVSFSPDGNKLATVGGDSLLKIWDIRSGKEIFTAKAHETKPGEALGINAVAWAHKKPLIATGGVDNNVCLWDAQEHKVLLTLRGRKQPINAVTFSTDDKLLASVSGESYRMYGELFLWDVATGELLSSLARHKGGATCVAFSPDSSVVVTGGADGALGFHDVKTMLEKRK
jgi:WD40 repeat protein